MKNEQICRLPVSSFTHLIYAKHISLAQRVKKRVGDLTSSPCDHNSQWNSIALQNRQESRAATRKPSDAAVCLLV